MNDLTMDHLEAGLHELVDRVEAPASDGTRQAIGRRTGVLRRRRQVRRATAAGALAVALVVGGLVTLRHEQTDVEIVPPAHDDGDGVLPAFIVELDGWEINGVTEEDTFPDGTAAELPRSATQVFRVPDRLYGPTVFLQHTNDSGTVAPPEGAEEVTIGGAAGYLAQLDSEHILATWNPAGQDAQVELRAYALDKTEVLAFADGLEARDDTITYPAVSEDRFGFTATELPEGIEEDPLVPLGAPPWRSRMITLSHPGGMGHITLTTTARGDTPFENELRGFQDRTDVEEVTVLGRSALLLHDTEEPKRWLLEWLEPDGTFVYISVTGETDDRALVDQVIDNLREVPDDEWADLVAAHN